MSQVMSEIQCSQNIADPAYKPGTIKYLKLVNFMCHESFELELGPRVNFIIGPNGSGKSALLTALVVALGGRATTTSRAKRNDEFVMYGKRHARITVIIHNYSKVMDKEQAFKPDDYGKFIIVEKNIFKDDVAKLVMRNDREKKISERKQELDEMLDHFGILINNPICILNQEVSKTFLHSKRPEDKFDLFMKATNLEQIEQDYDLAKKSHKEWKDCENRSHVAFRLLDAEYDSCKEKTSFLENRAKLNDTREKLNYELVWAIARDYEVISEEHTKKVQDLSDIIKEAEKEVERKKSKIRQYEEDIQVMKDKMRDVDSQIQETRKKIEDIRNKEKDVKTKKIQVEQKLDQGKRKIARYTTDRDSLEKSIADIKEQFINQNALDTDNEQRKLDIERLEKEISADQARERTIRQHTNQLGKSMTDTRTELHSANIRTNEVKGKLSQNNALLRRLRNGQENVLRKYGDHVVKIIEEVDKAHDQGKFIKKPVGPLGFYIKLRNPDLAAALEVHLGKNAHAFACDNHQDMTTLTQIFKRLANSTSYDFRFPTILTRPFGRKHDVMKFKAEHNIYKTMLDELEIKNEAVFNAIVDRASLESVLFIPEYLDAENLMINQNLVPKNTRCAYTKDCSVMHPKTATSGYKSFAMTPGKFMLFAEGNAGQISIVQREIALLEAELRDTEKIVQDLQNSMRAQRSEYDDNNRQIQKLIADVRQKEESLLNLRTTITAQPQELSALESELENYIGKIATERLMIERESENLASLENELKDILREKDEALTISKLRDDERTSISKMIEATESNLHEAQAQSRHKMISIEHRKKEKAEESQKLESTLEKLARSKQSLPTNSVRPEVLRKTEEINEEVRKIEAQLRVEQEEMQDPEELMRNLIKRMAEIENLRGLKDSNRENFTSTSNTLRDRREGFLRLRDSTIRAVSITFSTVMRSMKMNGELKIHLDDVIHRGEVVKKAKTLEMQIDTNYMPSQRANLLSSDNNNGNEISQQNRRTSRSQPANLPSGPRPNKRPRLDPALAGSPNNEKENTLKMTDTRSLSGGERSFSTVAFVLALWHHCASPFKLMDEIDVFMDMVTRRVSYNALIRFAQCSEDPGQFIFFSPLELPKFDDSRSYVRVFEMAAIVRKQVSPTQ